MKKYELMFIVKPDIEEGAVTNTFESMKKVLEDQKATIVEAKEMGQRELAYEINKYKNGYYFFFLIETKDASAVKEFERVALINENVIRHLVVKVEG